MASCTPPVPDLDDLPNKAPVKAATEVGDLKASDAPDHLRATPPAQLVQHLRRRHACSPNLVHSPAASSRLSIREWPANPIQTLKMRLLGRPTIHALCMLNHMRLQNCLARSQDDKVSTIPVFPCCHTSHREETWEQAYP